MFKNLFSFKVNSKILLLFFLIPVLLIFTACSSAEEKKYFEENGKADAFLVDGNGKVLSLKNGTASFYIDITDTAFLQIAKESIKEANKFTKLKISINYDKKSEFRIESYYSADMWEPNAKVDITWEYDWKILCWSSDPKINSATIKYNTHDMRYSHDGKLHVAIHEMGHVLGLKDYVDKNLVGETIMYGIYSKDYPTLIAFTKWDKENIKWKYGGDYSG